MASLETYGKIRSLCEDRRFANEQVQRKLAGELLGLVCELLRNIAKQRVSAVAEILTVAKLVTCLISLSFNRYPRSIRYRTRLTSSLQSRTSRLDPLQILLQNSIDFLPVSSQPPST